MGSFQSILHIEEDRQGSDLLCLSILAFSLFSENESIEGLRPRLPETDDVRGFHQDLVDTLQEYKTDTCLFCKYVIHLGNNVTLMH